MNLVQLPSLENGLKYSTKMSQCNQHVGRIWDLRQSVTYCNSVPPPSNSRNHSRGGGVFLRKLV